MNARLLTALPVYNERSHVCGVLDQVRRFTDQILVVDDGSTDGTSDLLASQPGVRTLTHPQNRGYGAALVSAFEYAIREGFEGLVTIDCDGQHQPQLIPEMGDVLLSDETIDMVSGSRYLQEFPGQSRPPEERRAINVKITRWLNETLGFGLTDAFCGFKAYRVSALTRLNITDPGYAMPLELWVQAWRLGFTIREFPVPLVYLEEERSFGGSLDDGQQRFAYYMSVLEKAVAQTGTADCSP